MIKFSIITVCLNAGEDLLITVNSTLKQRYNNYEIIVKDGLSTDGSVEKLPKDSRLKLIAQKDKGIYDAMNQAIEEASGDYLVFMNAGDAFFSNSTLSNVADQIDSSDIVMYYGRCYNESADVFSNSPKRLTPFFCYRSMICHQAMIFKREYIHKKKYECGYRVSADRAMLLDIVVKNKLKTKYIPTIVASYKGEGFCETEKNKNRIKAENERLRETYFSKKQRMLYGVLVALTLPGLRQKLCNNSKTRKYYKRLIGILYRNNRGVNHGK